MGRKLPITVENGIIWVEKDRDKLIIMRISFKEELQKSVF